MPTLSQYFLNFIFPVTCVQCGCDLPADDHFRLCLDCRGKIIPIGDIYCLKCGKNLPDGGAHCYSCLKNPSHYFEQIRSYGIYEGTLRDLIHKFKYRNKDYLYRLLGGLLIEVVQRHKELLKIDYIVPVPMHWFKKLRRGYNQTELLAGYLASYYNIPILLKNLNRTKLKSPQIKLKEEQRFENIKNCFNVRDGKVIKGKDILLIDDVCTTGATINECSRILRKAGANRVYAITLAKD